MTNKEYRNTWQGESSFTFWDSLNPYEERELRHDIRARHGVELPNSNHRASVRIEDGIPILTSYYTDVCAIVDGEARRLWDGYSATTMRHINKFLSLYGLDGLSKREWVSMEVTF